MQHLLIISTEKQIIITTMISNDVFILFHRSMDKLGCSAAQNISVVIRQTIFNGHYGLLDFRNFDPYPVNCEVD